MASNNSSMNNGLFQTTTKRCLIWRVRLTIRTLARRAEAKPFLILIFSEARRSDGLPFFQCFLNSKAKNGNSLMNIVFFSTQPYDRRSFDEHNKRYAFNLKF